MSSVVRTFATARLFGIRLALPLLAIYWTLIFVGTHTPKLHVPVPGVSDKFMHFGAFVGLSFLVTWAIPARDGRFQSKCRRAAVICFCYAILDELTQLLVRNRSAELLDLTADGLGIVAGISVYVLLRHRLFAVS